MLIENLYKVKGNYFDDNTGKLNTIISLNSDNDIFKGHFPQAPVLPGVCILQILKESIELIKDKKYNVVKVVEMKFLNMINPLLNPEIHFETKIEEVNEITNVSSTVFFENIIFCKIRINLVGNN